MKVDEETLRQSIIKVLERASTSELHYLLSIYYQHCDCPSEVHCECTRVYESADDYDYCTAEELCPMAWINAAQNNPLAKMQVRM